MDLFVQTIPFFFLLIGVELVVAQVTKASYYRLADSINNLSCGILQELVSVFFKAATIAGYVYVYEHWAVTRLRPSLWTWLAVLIGVDLCYYLFHRASHRTAFFWAFHVVHHQSEEYNLSVALRQSALGGFFGWIFYLPLALLGFSPKMFLVSYSINLLYQFWIHTRAIKKLGALEWVLNTPSHHRVHHGRNPKYLDRNYAGALIVWDRLLGTFVEEDEEPVYGIVHPLSSWNPVWANLHAWVDIRRNLRDARTWRDRLRCLFKPPGWYPAAVAPRAELQSAATESEVKLVLTLPKYDARGGLALDVYAAVSFIALLLASAYFFNAAADLSTPFRLAFGIFILSSVASLGGLFEKKRWAWPLEIARQMLFVAGALLYFSRALEPWR